MFESTVCRSIMSCFQDAEVSLSVVAESSPVRNQDDIGCFREEEELINDIMIIL